MVELVRAGRSPEEFAREFEPVVHTIYTWVAQAGRDSGKRNDGLTTAERAELMRLHCKVRQFELEREILSKAAVWFAGDADLAQRIETQRRRSARAHSSHSRKQQKTPQA